MGGFCNSQLDQILSRNRRRLPNRQFHSGQASAARSSHRARRIQKSCQRNRAGCAARTAGRPQFNAQRLVRRGQPVASASTLRRRFAVDGPPRFVFAGFLTAESCANGDQFAECFSLGKVDCADRASRAHRGDSTQELSALGERGRGDCGCKSSASLGGRRRHLTSSRSGSNIPRQATNGSVPQACRFSAGTKSGLARLQSVDDCGIEWATHVYQLGCHQDLSVDDLSRMAQRVRQILNVTETSCHNGIATRAAAIT